MKFRELLENKEMDLSLRKKFPEVRMVSREDSKKFILNAFVIQDKRRGKGEAKAFIKYLTELSKKYNKPVYLSSTDIYGADLEKLKKFYAKMGFKKNTDELPGVHEELVYNA